MPWFIKRDRPDLIERFNIPLDEYPRRCERADRRVGAELRRRLEDGEPADRGASAAPSTARRSSAASGDRHSRAVVYGNVPNRGLIDNLPRGCPSRCRAWSTATACSRRAIGALPPQLAALMQTNINVQELTVEAALTGKREHVYHAAMLDPHTAAELDLDQIWALVDELLDAHGDWLPERLLAQPAGSVA